MSPTAQSNKKITIVKCPNCECEKDTRDLAKTGAGKPCCDYCAFECTNCDEYEFNGDRVEDHLGDPICAVCVSHYFRSCNSCDELFHYESAAWVTGSGGNCSSCSDDDDDNFPRRQWSRNDVNLIKNERGKIVKSLRPFGIEAEANFNTVKSVNRVKKEINSHIGITPDAGAEFQTPPANGAAAEKMITDLSVALEKHGLKCGPHSGTGLHIHIDASEMYAMEDATEKIKSLWLFYIVFDDLIRSFIPGHRRSNGMCSKTKSVYDTVQKATTQRELEFIWYESSDESYIDQRKAQKKDGTRYHGFNLHPYFEGGHLEIRYHEGTTSAIEMLEWSNLHCLIMDKIVKGVPMTWFDKMRVKRYGKKRALYKLLGLSEASQDYWNKRQRTCAES